MASTIGLKFIEIFFLLALVSCDSLSFSRTLTCSKVISTIFGKEYCVSWHQTSTMEFYLDFFHLCFPSGTRVQTESGMMAIQNLQMGDKILSYDFESNRAEFSQFIGWISRDFHAISKFTSIRTDQTESSYYLSPLHNIAKIDVKENNLKQTDFVFPNSLKIGDSLFNLNSTKKLAITSLGSKQMKGLFAPLVKNSNFFIFPFENSDQDSLENMILVHCYSQIKDPQKYQRILTPLLSLSQLIRDDEQDPYRNPIFTSLRLILGQNWIDQNKTVSYDLDQLEKLQYGKTLARNLKKSDQQTLLDLIFSLFSDLRKRRMRKNAAVRLFTLLAMMNDNLIEACA